MRIAEGVVEDPACLSEMPLLSLQVFCYFWAGATIDDKPHLKGKGKAMHDTVLLTTLICLISLGHTDPQVSIMQLPLLAL